MESIWNNMESMESMEGIVMDSMEFPYGMNMEAYAKMAGPSAK